MSYILCDVEYLIDEVRKRPGLYDPGCVDYNNKFKKSELWEEVFEAVIYNWRNMTGTQKSEKGRDVKRRWKSLRDCFKRELTRQKGKRKFDHESSQSKRKYLYFDQLEFLMPVLKDRSVNDDLEESNSQGIGSSKDLKKRIKITEGINDPQNDKEALTRPNNLTSPKPDSDCNRDDPLETYDHRTLAHENLRPSGDKSRCSINNSSRPSSSKGLNLHFSSRLKKKKNRKSTARLIMEDMLRIIREPEIPSERQYDDDEHFLLSLHSIMKNLDNQQKIDARIEIMHAIRRVQAAQSLNFENSGNFNGTLGTSI